jgi:hypothetical protein
MVLWHSLPRSHALSLLLLVPNLQISGVVTSQGNPLPGAQVRVENTAKGQTLSTFSNERGRYILQLLPGAYRVTVDLFGFAPAERSVQISSDETEVDAHFELELKIPQPKPATQTSTSAEPNPAPLSADVPAEFNFSLGQISQPGPTISEGNGAPVRSQSLYHAGAS